MFEKEGIDFDMASRPAFGSASDPNEWVGVREADEMEVPPEGRAPDLALERMRIDELKMDEEAGPSDSKRSEVICSTDSTSASGICNAKNNKLQICSVNKQRPRQIEF